MKNKYNLKDATYNFHDVKFNVDGQLADHIKAPFPNKSFFMVLVGRPGSGKTTLATQLLTEKKENRVYNQVFDKIMLVMPQKSRASIKDNPFDSLNEQNLFETFDLSIINKIEENYQNSIKNNKKNFNQLLILDDITASLKNKNVEFMLKELSMNRRHYRLSIILLVQYLRSIPKPIRFQITDICYFQPSNQLDSLVLNDEFIGKSRKDFNELKEFVWKNSHDYMFICKDTNTFFKNTQQIIFNDETA